MDIDRLDIIISAEASKAEKQLNKLLASLEKLSGALGGLNTSGLTGLANSVQKLSIAMQGMNAVKTTDFTRLAKNIQKLAGIDTKSLNNAASSMSIIGKALSGLGTASANAQAIGEMAKNLSKLGNKGIQNSITNMPQLADALKKMMQTLQSAPRVSNNLIRMTEAMGKLASNGNRVGSAARSLNSGLRAYGSSADTATRKTKSLASAIGMLYAKYWAFMRAFKALFGGIEKSMDFSETVNYFEVAMRKIGEDASRNWQENGYDSAEAYAESFAKRSKELTEKMTGFRIDSDGNAVLTNQKSLGLDPDKVLQYQAQYAQMADSIGMTEEAALNTSKALTMLGTDWASLRNISFDQAWEKFASALAGQSRAVRSLGIDITQATLQEYAYKYGLETAVSEMNQATKAQLRLLAILDQSKVAFGDLANTMQSPANQLRLLQQNFSNLARIIGNIFLPIVAKVLPYINGVMIALQRLFQWIGNLLGIKLTNINTSIGGMSDSIGDLIDSGDDGLGGIADNAGNASDALNNANDSAKKLKRTILGFDELNVLNDNSDDSGSKYNPGSGEIGGLGDTGLLDNAIADALAEYEKAWNDAFNRMENKAVEFADRLTSAFKKLLKAAEPTLKAIKKLWNEGLSKLGKFTWTALKDFYDDFLVPVGRWTLGKGIPDLVNATNDFLNKIHWERINTSLKQFWQALAPFATSVGDGLIEFYRDLTSIGADFINKVVPGGLDALANALDRINPDTAEKIGYSLGIAAAGVLAFKALAPVVATLSSVADAIKKWDKLKETFAWLGGVKYLGIAAGLAGVVVALDKFGIIDVDWDWLWSKVKQIKDILAEFIGKVDVSGLAKSIGNLWKVFQPFAKGFADALLDAFDFLLNDIGAPLLNALIKIFEGLASVLGKMDPEQLEKLGSAIAKIATAIALIKISKSLISDLKLLYDGFSNIRNVLSKSGTGKALSELIKDFGSSAGNASGQIGSVGSSSSNASTGVKALLSSIGKLGLIFGTATAAAWGGTEAVKAMNKESVDTAEATQILSDSLMDMKKSGDLSYDAWDKLYGIIIDGQSAGKDASEIYKDVATTLEKMGKKTDVVTESARKAGISLDNLSKNAKNTSNQINNTSWTDAKNGLKGLNTSIGNVNFSKMTKDAKDAMTGISNSITGGRGNVCNSLNSALIQPIQANGSQVALISKNNGLLAVQKYVEGTNSGKSSVNTAQKNVFANSSLNTELKTKFSGYAAYSVEGYNQKLRELQGSTAKSMGDFARNGITNPFTKNIGSLYNVGRGAILGFKNGFQSVHIPTPSFSVSSSKYYWGSSSFSIPKFSLRWFAQGGFPNAGELFMANEKGPEMIGKMGNRNVVANNKQITDGIKNAVVEGMIEVAMATSSGQSDNKPYILHAVLKTEDNEVLARAVEKGNMSKDWRYNPCPSY